MDQNGFGSSADLGLNAEFKLSDFITANVTISNGEGYKKIQDDDGKQKFAGSLIITPADGFTAKIYADSQAVEDSDAVSSLGFFAGYKGDSWRIGAEYNKLNNAKKYSSPMIDHELDGFSFYSTYAFNKKFEIFGRFDQLGSNTLAGESMPWNESKNGDQIIIGLQYAPLKGLKFALNYQGFNYDDPIVNNKSMLFLNAEFKL
jgi:predicted porin